VISCVCRTTDAGKRCRASSDCQGKCLANDPVEREVVSAGPPARGYFVGHCAELFLHYGCRRYLDQTEPGPLDQLPPALCID
jgi:hypothetical protein